MAKKHKKKTSLITLEEAQKYVRGGLPTVWFLINTSAVYSDMIDGKMMIPKEQLLLVAERLFLLVNKKVKKTEDVVGGEAQEEDSEEE